MTVVVKTEGKDKDKQGEDYVRQIERARVAHRPSSREHETIAYNNYNTRGRHPVCLQPPSLPPRQPLSSLYDWSH